MDRKKAASNLRQHGVSFGYAMTVFRDWLSITVPDPDHSEREHRYLVIGKSSRGRMLVVSHLERDESVRIISARRANARERRNHGN